MIAVLVPAAILAALLCVPLVRRVAIAVLFRDAISRASLARQPDRVHLKPAGADAWRDAAWEQQAAAAIQSLGFIDAGTYTLDEVPGTVARLFAHPDDGYYASIFEHAQAGHWIEYVRRFRGGGGIVFSTRPASGIHVGPGGTVVHVPGADPAALYVRVKAHRPPAAAEPVTAADAVRNFEDGWARHIAQIKQRGLTTMEVVRIAVRKAA
jgi:hypothetical protein